MKGFRRHSYTDVVTAVIGTIVEMDSVLEMNSRQ